MKEKILSFWNNEKEILRYILILFIFSRIALTIVGVTARHFYNNDLLRYSNHVWLDIWGIWDSGYYLDIAKRGYSLDQNFEFQINKSEGFYSQHQINFAFFPLYPLTIRLINSFLNNYFISGLVVSNLALMIAAFFIYKLSTLLFDKQVAKSSVKYLLLFPTSFILSGVFSESLALLLIILSSYFMGKKKWITSGVMAALAALTKITGLLAIVILALKKRKKILGKKEIFILTLPIMAIALLFYYQYRITGDPFIFFSTEKLGWGANFTNPIQTLGMVLLSLNVSVWFLIYKLTAIIFIITEIILIIFSYRKIHLSYWLFWLLAFILPLTSGVAPALSMPRHSLLFFPQYIVLALAAKTLKSGKILTISFVGIQLLLMALWVNGYAVI